MWPVLYNLDGRRFIRISQCFGVWTETHTESSGPRANPTRALPRSRILEILQSLHEEKLNITDSHQRKNKSNSTPETFWNWGWRREPSSPLQENLPKTSLLNIPVPLAPPPFQQIVSLWGLILLHLFLYFKGIWIQSIWKHRGLNFVLLIKIDYICPRFIK